MAIELAFENFDWHLLLMMCSPHEILKSKLDTTFGIQNENTADFSEFVSALTLMMC